MPSFAPPGATIPANQSTWLCVPKTSYRLKKNPLLRRLGASVSFLLLASALPASAAAAAKHKSADPRSRQRAKHAQHGVRVEPHPDSHANARHQPNRAAHVAHAASAKGHASRFRQLGLASWYGRGFHGHRTANGEHYDMYAMTAAHRTLPLGSYVRVTSLANSKSVVVRINDRGPYARGRVIDLSYLAASALGMHRAGVTKVAIERVDKPQVERIAHRQMQLTTHG
ncbi:Endolytic peptidoglycan transglycosylase RlpA [Paraburkholderia sabiae]|nr:Endolytic peptidoglycan transglycosylase RlpA [Paraburkholderia sabiae]